MHMGITHNLHLSSTLPPLLTLLKECLIHITNCLQLAFQINIGLAQESHLT